jgi:hypothetical protein
MHLLGKFLFRAKVFLPLDSDVDFIVLMSTILAAKMCESKFFAAVFAMCFTFLLGVCSIT